MKLISNSFEHNGSLPTKHVYQGVPGGQNISVHLKWGDAPPGTKSFALAMVDISSRNWVHWMVINIPSEVNTLGEGASIINMPEEAKELYNTFGSIGYGGPEPPPDRGPHSYVITVYALSVDKISLPEQTTYDEFLRAIEGRVLDKASINGKFSWRSISAA